MSLTDTMRERVKNETSGALRSMSPDIRDALEKDDQWNYSIFDLERATFRR